MRGTNAKRSRLLRRLPPSGAAAVGVAVLTLAAAPARVPAKPTTVTVGTLVAETSFNPYKNETGYFLQYLQPVYDTLIRRRNDGSYAPDLATRWSYARGSKNTEFTLTIRKGVTFSDGTPLDANAVKANLDYARGAGGPRASELAAVSSVTVKGTSTVVLRLSRSDPSLPLTLSQVNGMMVSPKALLDPVALDRNPVGAGPYVLDAQSTSFGRRYTFVRNKRYWQSKAFRFDRIVIRVYASVASAFAAVRSGQVQLAPGAPADLVAGRSARLTALAWPANCLGLWLWDRGGKLAPPLAKLAVRQALNYAVDRRSIFRTIYNGQGIPGTQIFVPGSKGYDPALDKRYPYDPARARKLLAQAGYPKGFTLPVLSVAVAAPQLRAIASDLKAVGVRVEVQNVKAAALPGEIAKPRFPALMFTYTWQDAYTDSQAMVLPGGFFNPFNSSDSRITALWNQAAQAESPAAASKLLRAESARIVDLAWFLIVGYGKTVYWVDARKVAGVEPAAAQPVPSIYGWKPA
jgi:peptide/nickel transport system substrate-binding protein